MNRIFVTGDTHNNLDITKLKKRYFTVQQDLTKDDYLIILGDCGFNWYNSKKDNYLLKWFNNKNFTTLGVMGNHENYTAIEKLPIVDLLGGKAHHVHGSIYYLINGEVYTIGNKNFLILGGADSTDKEFRTPNINWWKQERITDKEVKKAIENIKGKKIDSFLTHTSGSFGSSYFGYVPSESDKQIDKVLDKLGDCPHYFGHLHDDKIIAQNERVIYNDIIELL